jgi:hypothetical protein
MNSSYCLTQGSVTDVPLLLGLIAIGGIVFACSVMAFRRAPMFGPTLRVVVAACVAILSVIGLIGPRQVLKGPADADVTSSHDSMITAITLPYAAFALALIALLLSIALMKFYTWIRARLESVRKLLNKNGNPIDSNSRPLTRGRFDDRRLAKFDPHRRRRPRDAD